MVEKQENKKDSTDALSEVFKEDSFEGLIHELWTRYRGYIQIAILTAVLSVIGIQGVKIYKSYQISKLQDMYLEAKESGNEMGFAQKHPREPLAGLVWLAEADKSFKDKKFEDATEYYDKAKSAFRKTALRGRAMLGSAMAKVMGDNKTKGTSELGTIANDSTIKEALRAEAYYQLAILSLEDKNVDQSMKYLSSVAELPYSGVWAQKAQFLTLTTPALAKARQEQAAF